MTLGKLLLPQFPFPASYQPAPVPLVASGATFSPPAGFNFESEGRFSIFTPQRVLEMEAEGDQGTEGSCSRDTSAGVPAPPRQETSKRARHPQLPASGELQCPSSPGMPRSLLKKPPLLINLRLKL